MRQLSKSALIALSLALLGPSAASAADGVKLASPFTDYRQAVAAQYGTPTPPAGAVLGATETNTPPAGAVLGTERTQVVAQPQSNRQGVAGAAAESTGKLNGGRSLPFTGVDLLLVVLIGVGLVAAGALLRAGARVRRRAVLARPLG